MYELRPSLSNNASDYNQQQVINDCARDKHVEEAIGGQGANV